MTITDYLINAIFVLVVLRQARERELDRRSIVVPLILVFFVAQMYLHSIPTAGNDLVLIGLLAAAGLTLGIASGFATHVRAGDNGLAVARVGWLAATLLIAGIGSRMVFAFAVSHGLRSDVASVSIAHHISAAAWPTALVLMAICEVVTRITIVQLRGRKAIRRPGGNHGRNPGHRLTQRHPPPTTRAHDPRAGRVQSDPSALRAAICEDAQRRSRRTR
jgi:hypothetical protein